MANTLTFTLSGYLKCFPGDTVVKNLPANTRDTGDVGSVPGSGRSTRVGYGNPPQYSCLGNPTDSRAWRATVHRVAKSQTHFLATNYQEQIQGVYLKITVSLDNGIMNGLYLLPYAFLYVLIYFPIFLLL